MSKQVLWLDPTVIEALDMTVHEFLDRYQELVDMGMLTETKPATESEGPHYVRSTMPLENPEQYSEEVRAKHAENYASWRGQFLVERGGTESYSDRVKL